MEKKFSNAGSWDCARAFLFAAVAFIASDLHAQSVTRSGQDLVQIHCTRCHSAPDPRDLSRDVWPIRLAQMGRYLGLPMDTLPDFVSSQEVEGIMFDRETHKVKMQDGREFNINAFRNMILPQPIISREEFVAIRDYFVSGAPLLEEQVLPQPDHPTLAGFEMQVPELDIEPNGLIISTRVDEVRDILYVGRAIGRMMFALKDGTEDVLALDMKSGKRLARKPLETEPTVIELTETGIRLGIHGEFPIVPGNGQGYITDLVGFAEGNTTEHMLVSGRHRIIQLHTLDMNNDGLDDIVANMFGDGVAAQYGGGLSIFFQQPGYAERWAQAPASISTSVLEGALEEKQLSNLVGMIGSTVADFDNNGLPDVAALVAQGYQKVIVFYNQGNGQFQQQVVADRTPSFGGNTIYAADVDGDGNSDLVFLSGDNVYSNFVGGVVNTPKPYHGVTVLKNNGNRSFEQRYFYPMHGAIRAAIADFDGDGDQDIAAIALYPDWRWEVPETFVYLENVGDFQFRPASLARKDFAIWLSIEAADVDDDERPDIVLGLGDWPRFVPDDWKTRDVMQGRGPDVPSIMYLLNRTSTGSRAGR